MARGWGCFVEWDDFSESDWERGGHGSALPCLCAPCSLEAKTRLFIRGFACVRVWGRVLFLGVASLPRGLQRVAGPRVRVPLVGGPAVRSPSQRRGAGGWRSSSSVFVPVSTSGPQAPGVVFVLVWARAASINCGVLGCCRVARGAGRVCLGGVRACGRRRQGLPEFLFKGSLWRPQI